MQSNDVPRGCPPLRALHELCMQQEYRIFPPFPLPNQ